MVMAILTTGYGSQYADGVEEMRANLGRSWLQ